ncbi:MAG: D-arabinono-1,4-lactone oxidase [Alphaproteobacteria bacterium]
MPAVRHVAWGGRDFTRPGYTNDPPEPPEGRTYWQNWSGLQRATPSDILFPGNEEELADIMKTAAAPVRPVGSGHSFTGLAPSRGLMVDVTGMYGLLNYDAATGHAVFGAGTHLTSASEALASHGRAFPNLPDVDVQTLAGSFATGTHGTGRTLTALHDYIEAFRLVTARGEVIDVTRSGNPELFEAGKVSLGALGIVTRITVRTVEAFKLRRIVRVETIGDVLEKADELSRAHRHFEFYWFPHTGYAATITHDLHEGPASGTRAGADDSTLQELKTLRDEFGWWPWLRRKIIAGTIPKGVVEDVSDDSRKLLSTTRPTRFNEMEYHLPLETGLAALREIMRRMETRRDVFFPVEVRFTAGDGAWLSPFQHGPRISIATHTAVDERYEYLFSDYEPVHLEHGGRPHWGKLHSLGRDRLEDLYPDYGRFLELRRELDPEGKLLNPHLTKLFGIEYDA